MKYQSKRSVVDAIFFTEESISEVLAMCPEIKKLDEPMKQPSGALWQYYYHERPGANLYIEFGNWVVKFASGKSCFYSPAEFESKFEPWTSQEVSGAISAKFINEGAALVIDGPGQRMSVIVTEDNDQICTDLFRMILKHDQRTKTEL